jgi:hypothetical protein
MEAAPAATGGRAALSSSPPAPLPTSRRSSEAGRRLPEEGHNPIGGTHPQLAR